MILLEKLVYASITFVFSYIIISLSLRLFEITTVYSSHLIGGIVATIASMGVFMYLLVVKKSDL